MNNYLQKFGTTEKKLELVKTLCNANQRLVEETGTGVGFEYGGQFISNIFMDETGRFELTLTEAIDKYGMQNVAEFYHNVLNNTAVQEAALRS